MYVLLSFLYAMVFVLLFSLSHPSVLVSLTLHTVRLSSPKSSLPQPHTPLNYSLSLLHSSCLPLNVSSILSVFLYTSSLPLSLSSTPFIHSLYLIV